MSTRLARIQGHVTASPCSSSMESIELPSLKTVELVLSENNALLTVTFGRKAINQQMMSDFLELCQFLRQSTTIHVVVIVSKFKHFSTGLDLTDVNLAEMDNMSKSLQAQRKFSDMMIQLSEIPQVTIAVLNGAVSGGGLALALACDLRYAVSNMKANVAMRRIGFSGCDLGISYFLPRLVGSGIATELMLSGDFIDAKRSLQTGLVNGVGETIDDTLALAMGYCKRILRTSPLGLRLTKEGLRMAVNATSLRAATAVEDRQQVITMKSGDVEAGIMAFMTKQKPVFKG